MSDSELMASDARVGTVGMLQIGRSRSAPTAARLRLVVNGRALATATDPRPLGPVAGVGVIAASIGGRTVAGFDDIEVRSVD